MILKDVFIYFPLCQQNVYISKSTLKNATKWQMDFKIV